MNQESDESKAAAQNFATLMGGKHVLVTLQDASRETVKVLQVPIRDYPKLAAALGDELDQVEIYCGKPKGWAAQLMPESHHLVMETAQEINADFFGAWLRRRVAAAELISPGAMDRALAAPVPTSPSSPPRSHSRPG